MKPVSFPVTLLTSCALLLAAGAESAGAFGKRDSDPTIEIHLDVLSRLNADKAANSGAAAAASGTRDSASPFGPPTPPPVHAVQAVDEHSAPAVKAHRKTRIASSDTATPKHAASGSHARKWAKHAPQPEKLTRTAEVEPPLALPGAVVPPPPKVSALGSPPAMPHSQASKTAATATPLPAMTPAESPPLPNPAKADQVPPALPIPTLPPPSPSAAPTSVADTKPLPAAPETAPSQVAQQKKGMFSDISRGFSDVLSNDASAHSEANPPAQEARQAAPPPLPIPPTPPLPSNPSSSPIGQMETAQNSLTPLTIPPAPIPPAPPMPLPKTAEPVLPAAAAIPPAPPPSTAAMPPAPPSPSAAEAYSGATPDVSVAFTASQTDLPLDSTAKLDILAQALSGNPSARATVVAYASGPETSGIYPKRVSLARGIAVRNYLTTTKNIDIERVNVKAMGNKNGGGPGDRVDIFISK